MTDRERRSSGCGLAHKRIGRKWLGLSQLRKRPDPFQLARTIESKLERILSTGESPPESERGAGNKHAAGR